MKILIVFLDMIHTDHLSLYNNSRSDTSLDIALKRLGGTLFNRCYTPGPDTPRSNACMQTGLYPHFNGVDVRVKWPRDFIKPEVDTFFDKAIEKGYSINICYSKVLDRIGLLKMRESEKVKKFFSLDDFVLNAQVADNSISYVADQDMHFAIDDYGPTEKGVNVGFEKIGLLFDKYLSYEYLNKFDHVFFYSDHGAKLETDIFSTNSILNLLSDNRTRVLMFYHNKGAKDVIVDSRLSCNLDIYSTIVKLLGYDDLRHGKSLLSEPENCRTVHVEDHSSFTVDINLAVTQWRIISEDFDVKTNIKETAIDKGVNSDYEKAIDYLRIMSPNVVKLENYINFINSYIDLKESKCYFVGGARLSKQKKRLVRCSSNILKMLRLQK